MAKTSIIIPIFNEKNCIEGFIKDLKDYVSKINDFDFEIIAVDDGSIDGTGEILDKLSDISVIHNPYNMGYGSAIKTGILSAKGDKILIIDADGTYPISKIDDLVQKSNDFDMVVGSRHGKNVHHSIIKRIAKWPINQLANYLVNFKIPDLNSGLRIFRRDLALKYFSLLPNGFSLTTNITLAFLSDGYRVKYIPIDYHKRIGNSKVRPIRDAINYLVLVVRMILFYNPLKFFIPLMMLFFIATVSSISFDIYMNDLTEKSLILFTGFIQITILGFLADLINKRGHE